MTISHTGPFAMTSSRSEAVDFTEPIFVDHWGLVCPLQKISENVIVKPVEDIWELLLGTKWALIILMGLADYVFFGLVNWDYMVGFFHRTILNQGVENLKDSQLYQKIFITAWVFPVFIFVQVYLGTMTALLASSSLQKPIMDEHNSYSILYKEGHKTSISAPKEFLNKLNGLYVY